MLFTRDSRVLSVYQVGGISNRYHGYTYAITNEQNKSAEEQRSPVYMISHFKIKKPKVGNPNMYKINLMIGNSCNEITSSLHCWTKHQCISAKKLKLLFSDLYDRLIFQMY